jgi:hypothetical protein
MPRLAANSKKGATMRSILLKFAVLTFLLAGPSWAAVTVTNSGAASCSGCQAPAVTGKTALAGDLMFVQCATVSTATLNSPTDSGLNTYTLLKTSTTGGTRKSSFYVQGMTGFTGGSVICHTAANAAGVTTKIIEFAGLATASALDIAANDLTYASAASPWASNTLTSTACSDVVITDIVDDAQAVTFSAPSGFTIATGNNDTAGAVAYQAVSALQNTTYSWTGNLTDNYSVGVVAFKQAGSLCAGTRKPIMF